jgi:hypothetical protein
MTHEHGSDRGPRHAVDPAAEILERDLAALAARSRRDMKPLSETLSIVSGRRPGRFREEPVKSIFGFLGARPGLAFGGAVAAIALALLLVPISYERVVGHDVSLTLENASPEAARQIAGELKDALAVDAVRVDAAASEAGRAFTLAARVAAGAGPTARAVTDALASALVAKGYAAQAAVTPVTATVSGNVYAMVMNNVITVSIDGKTDAELSAEIAEKLAQAGLPNAQVSVTREGEDFMKVEVNAHHEGGAAPDHEPIQLQLTSGGEDLGGIAHHATVRLKKVADEAGTHLVVEVEDGGRSGTATVDDPESLTDAELSAEIHRQLAALGLGHLSVSSQDGRIQVMAVDPGVAPAGEQPTSWGRLKEKAGK